MCEKQFIKTYCNNCGTQRCEGPGTEWFEGCPKRWNLDGYGDAAAEIERLNKKIIELGITIMKNKHSFFEQLSELNSEIYDGVIMFELEEWLDFLRKSGATEGTPINHRYELGAIKPRCHKCIHETVCSKDKDNDHTCPDYRRDAPDGGFYG